MSHHFDRDGKPLDPTEWANLLGDREYKRVAWDDIPGVGHVSTVWLGLDHGHGVGPPVIFETMVFPKDKKAEQEQERYATEAEARAGHAAMVAKWSKKQ